jgi:GntR family transcriptional regulator
VETRRPIPSEFELAARYKVSQGTVRKAIDELAQDNLLIRRQGKGTFVATHAEQQVQYRFLKLKPDQGDFISQGPAATTQIIDCKRKAPITMWPKPCALRGGDAVLQLRRVLSFGGYPPFMEDIWLPGGPSKA